MGALSERRDEGLLLDRIGRGDREAFEELYRLYAPRLFGFLVRTTRRPDLVEELVDEVLLAVWRQASEFEGRSRPSTWIFGMAYRQAMQALRAQGRRKATEPLSADLLDTTEGPESRTLRRERSRLLSGALGELSAEQRAVVELTYGHGLSYPEIAETLDCPVGTVKTRMYYARRRLRGALDQLAES
jgi:RNA polymerase sigma factor (sigma-70 family)